MPFVLTASSTVLCGVLTPVPTHGGTVTVMPSPKLLVQGSGVLVETSLTGVATGTCTNVPPPQTKKPCTGVTAIITGRSLKLTVGGSPVLLDTLTGTTDGVPPGTLAVTANQTKLTAV